MVAYPPVSTVSDDMIRYTNHIHKPSYSLKLNSQEGCTVKAMDGASENGHLDICKYLHTHRREGCERALDLAAQQGAYTIPPYILHHSTL